MDLYSPVRLFCLRLRGAFPGIFPVLALCTLLSVSGCGTGQQTTEQQAAVGQPSTVGNDQSKTESVAATQQQQQPEGNSQMTAASQVPALTIGHAETSGGAEVFPGIESPRVYAVDEVNLAEEAMIIGVLINTEARAYLMDAMTEKTSRAVNDMIRGIPVSVTYCDETKAVRVFSTSAQGERIALSVTAISESGMSLLVNGLVYDHTSESIPLNDVDFVQTAWIAWKTEHPETKVFLGSMAEKFVTPVTSPAPQ